MVSILCCHWAVSSRLNLQPQANVIDAHAFALALVLAYLLPTSCPLASPPMQIHQGHHGAASHSLNVTGSTKKSYFCLCCSIQCRRCLTLRTTSWKRSVMLFRCPPHPPIVPVFGQQETVSHALSSCLFHIVIYDALDKGCPPPPKVHGVVYTARTLPREYSFSHPVGIMTWAALAAHWSLRNSLLKGGSASFDAFLNI